MLEKSHEVACPPRTEIEVSTPGFSVQFKHIGQDLLYGYRLIHRKNGKKEIIIFGNYWGFLFADIPKGFMTVRNGDVSLSLEGRLGIYLPPFTLLEVCQGPGELPLHTFASTVPTPEFLPAGAFFFPYLSQTVPENTKEIFAIIRSASPWTFLGQQTRVPAIVRHTKQVIDKRFHQGDSIKEMLSQLSASPTVLSRHFKRVYGITPVAYRNQLRVMSSLWMLLSEGYSSTDAGHACGFHNLSAFYRQFKKVNKSHPSEYRFY